MDTDQSATPRPPGDLFGDASDQLPARAIGPQESSNVTPLKRPRGRPAVNWSERPRSNQERDLFELSMELEQREGYDPNQGFIATACIYASLPHSEIEGAFFKRKSNTHTTTILVDPDIGLPYGKIPRVMTAFLCTEAKRGEKPRIYLGKSQAEFASKLGLTSSGGHRGDMTRLKDQAKRLFTSHITLIGTPGSEFHWQNVNLTNRGMLLWNPHDPEEKAPWNSWLDLSKDFFEECCKHAVPIQMDIVHKLRSPLAIDIYIWMTYRFNAIKEPKSITWSQLKWQFGANYSDDPNGLAAFKYNFLKQLRVVLAAWPQAKVAHDASKLTLLPSPTHIAAKRG
jgi:hypothetical protein